MIYTSRPNQGAIIEWILAFIFFFFASSFGFDFHPTNVMCRRFTRKIPKQVTSRDIAPVLPVPALRMVVKDAQFLPAVAGNPSFEVRVTFCLAQDA